MLSLFNNGEFIHQIKKAFLKSNFCTSAEGETPGENCDSSKLLKYVSHDVFQIVQRR